MLFSPRNRDHAYDQKCDKDAEQFTQRSDWINISVSDSQQRGCRPPDSGKCIGEYFRLSFMFQAVHTQAGGEHENEDRKHGREKLLTFAVQHFGYQFKRNNKH